MTASAANHVGRSRYVYVMLASCAILTGLATSCQPDESRDQSLLLEPLGMSFLPSDIRERPRDFVDGRGHKWTWMGAAQFTDEPYVMPTHYQRLATEPSRDELALGMRGVMLLGDQEYRVLDPVYDIADQIIALKSRPDLLYTGQYGPPSDLATKRRDVESSTAVKPQTIFYDPNDDRGPSLTPNEGPEQAVMAISSPYSDIAGTLNHISGSTAWTAAHVVAGCNNTWKRAGMQNVFTSFLFGADATAPNSMGYFAERARDATVIIVPQGWRDWYVGSNCLGTGYYDFAGINLTQDMYASHGVSFYWTAPWSNHSTEFMYSTGYPIDKWIGGSPWAQKMYTSWTARDSWQVQPGLFGMYLDVGPGNSGGCVFFYSSGVPAPQCMGVVIAQYPDGNLGRMWDSTTYSLMVNYTPFPW